MNAAAKPRILFLNRRDPAHPQGGGAEAYTREVARGLLDRGWEADWFCSRFPGAAARETLLPGLTLLRRGGELTVHAHGRRWAGRHARDYRAIVEEFNGLGFFTARLPASRMLIYQLYGREFWGAEFGALGGLLAALERRWLRAWRDRPVATISESTRSDLESLGLRAVSVLPVGLSRPALSAVPEKPEPFTCAYVGRLRRTKNPEDALRAFGEIRRAVPGARLTVVGHGPQEADLRARYAAADVEFRGFVSEDEKFALLRRAHLVLIPSLREGWNLVVTEAAAMGAPCVGYRVPGVRDSVRDGETGVLVEARDWPSLAREAIALARDRARLARLAAAGLTCAAGFTWDRTRDAFAAWVEGK